MAEQRNNNQENIVDAMKPTPMDIPSSLNTFLSALAEKSLDKLIGESEQFIDTRALPNALATKFTAIDLLMTYVSYEEKLQEGKTKQEAIGEALAETLGGTLGGAVGGSLFGPVGAVGGAYIVSRVGLFTWDKFMDFLKALAEWSVQRESEESIQTEINTEQNVNSYAEKARSNLREATRIIPLIFDPLVIDLDGDGIELTDINDSTAMFDLSGSGFANKVGWISKDDGFLVLDKNNDNRINDISEMFGNATQSGFAMLSLYDTNRDGRIDAFDDVFKNLKVWQDKNADGRTDEGELRSLSELGIKSINLNTKKTNINQGGNQITEIGTVEKEDGTKTQAGNVNFELDRLYRLPYNFTQRRVWV
ncbi:hypothetical protein [Thermocrinis minervae]|uniref:Uncharacterized protein n=1 Tax=Thermocrinis minervae TaxID=381751 RepID=A0A1M6SZ53_9AQUI|nr:hypothetical protein [Thermocrinis minervae]SHK49899.1 hypothetical protein SAMN05444391_1225 [Thermocrinis minervae]